MPLKIAVDPALHPLFETVGYFSGFAAYRWLRARFGDPISTEQRWPVIAAAAVGALFGSRALGLAEQWSRLHGSLWQWLLLPGGKTIVGGLLGGWLAVEVVKRLTGLRRRTGDLFAVPLCVGIAVGRVGCLLAGLADDTYGTPTELPWAVDFGDGIGRHPTQAYEILFLFALGLFLYRRMGTPHREGLLFRIFLAAYLGWRLVIDFLKPQPLVFGMNLIQWACVAGLGALAWGRSDPRPCRYKAAPERCDAKAGLECSEAAGETSHDPCSDRDYFRWALWSRQNPWRG
jgi:prolipoprotein diacylglyceryltransferase